MKQPDLHDKELQDHTQTLAKVQSDLDRQEQLLKSISFVATHLVTASPEQFEQTLWESLRAIGQAAMADRAYIWQNFEEGGKLHCRQTHEWSEGAQPQQGEDFTLFMPYDIVPMWRDCIMHGVSLNGPIADFPSEEREVLEPQGILSILVLPLWQDQTVWGFIGFDDCHRRRTFSKAEEQALQTAGILMTSSIIRNIITQGLVDMRNELQSQGRLLRAVNHVAGVLLQNSADGFENYILRSLEILARSVDADRGFLWRNSMKGDQLCGTELCEWARNVHSFTESDERPFEIPLDNFLPEWRDTLLVGRNLNMLVRDMGAEFRASPASKGVLTTMNIPLVIHGDFWGMVGFDDMHRERLYTEAEMDILKSGGMLIASTIMRNEMMENLMEAKEQALSSTRAKSEFLSRMSHEIRTPLNAVIGMTTLAEKSSDMDKIQYYLGRINGSSRQLLSIINDVLDMSKIESGKFEIYPSSFDFEKMLQHSINVVQTKLDERHQELVLELDRVFDRLMVGDELRLSQVLINLLTNAVKFTPDFGVITLRIRETARDADSSLLHVEVADTGIGISKENQAHLFSSFQQADGSITRQYGGTGLGLAICKMITGLMGGDIWVESEEGVGSTFLFEVAVGWGSKLHPLPRALKENLRILVADDSRDVLDYFSHILSGFRLECDTAASGAAAVELAKQAEAADRPYAIAFVDWMMPGMNGEETARQLVEITFGHTIIVIISVADQSDVEQSMKSTGVTEFLPKPVLPSALYEAIVQLTDDTLVDYHTDLQFERNWAGKRILLAEDIDINREIVMALLEDTGVTIDCAENGEQAVEMFREQGDLFDLILMDVQMPVMDGITATRRIRAITTAPKAADIPIIAMTANAFKEDIQNCLAAGMNHHVAKPIELDHLLKAMDRYLR